MKEVTWERLPGQDRKRSPSGGDIISGGGGDFRASISLRA